ncbi:hypothetical protein [Pseudophaeobacter sp. TrK17]|uniref:hypothetical protein n=1 Tax=Pseudophaeobacter sp. TrK17 TaxID=2815167 RepID=UPI0035CFC551
MASDLKEAKQRVRDHLVQPLTRLGLRRTSGVTVAQFDATIDELCGRLSYMTAINLDALAEQASRLAGGKDRSLFPSASKILAWAADIQPPEDSASPLLIAVFSGPLGSQAMAEDWAPELRSYVRKERIWPKGLALDAIKERAREARRRLELIEEDLRRGRAPNPVDLDMQEKRVAAAEKCALIMGQIEVSK